MITTLYKFADLLKEDENLREFFSPARNPFEGRESKGKVLVGEVEGREFKEFNLEDYKRSLLEKYLYRSLSGPNSTGIVPTLYVNQSGPDSKGKRGVEKTCDKLESCLKNNQDLLRLSNSHEIIDAFKTFTFNSDYSYIVTLKLNSKWLGEIDEFIERFNQVAYKKYFDQQSKGKSIQENQVCAITGKRSTVFGFVNTLGFAVESKSFIRGGFHPSSGYKMFPVSSEVIPILEGAKEILLHKVSDYLFQSWDEKSKSKKHYNNVKYALIPHFVFVNSVDIAKEVAETFLRKAAYNINNQEIGARSFINGTESILQAIINEDDLNQSNIYYDIIFFEQQQAQFKIYLEINDILPSRISQVIDAKEKAEQRYKVFTIFQTKEGNIKSQRITLFHLREYFQTGNKNVQPAFYKLITSIFTGQPYDDSKLLKLVLDTWKTSFKKNFHDQENAFNYLVKYSLGNLCFLNLLGIFKKQSNMSEENQVQEKHDAFSFIEGHPAYFTKEYLKGAFIFGCLSSILLKEQKPGNAFMKELNGLNIDKSLITKKFPKLIFKLRQYKKVIPDLEIAAEKYFAINDKAAKDEISFAFTMGLVLQKDFERSYWANQPKSKGDNQNSENHD